MKIAILISHPTQFEGPFFQFAARDPEHELLVLYTNTERLSGVLDPELKRRLNWGVDLLSGYNYEIVPAKGRLSWLRRKLAVSGIDLLIVNSYVALLDIAAAMLARTLRVPVALRLDMVMFNNTSRLKRMVKRVLMLPVSALFNRFFVTGTLSREYLAHFRIPERRVSIFTYPIDEKFFHLAADRRTSERQRWRQQLGIPDDAFVVTSVTKFNHREAPWDLVEALVRLKEQRIVGLFIGDGEKREALKKRASDAAPSVALFLGYMPYVDLPGLYAASDLFVHPAQNEPWGVSVGEAMAAGLPVIASTRVGAGRDLIVSGENGHVYPVGDRDKLAACIKSVEAMDSRRIVKTNERIVAAWGHQSTWTNILAAAQAGRRA